MVDRAITFSRSMVLAIDEGRKTMTRRLMPYQSAIATHAEYFSPIISGSSVYNYAGDELISTAPYRVGDRLWVRETHYALGRWEPIEGVLTPTGQQKWRFVDCSRGLPLFEPPAAGFRSSMSKTDPATIAWHKRLARFMPRKYSRTRLLVTAVRVERLHAITEVDARAEGIVDGGCLTCGMPEPCECARPEPSARDAFAALWNSLHGPDAWDADPWVAVINFQRVKPDQLAERIRGVALRFPDGSTGYMDPPHRHHDAVRMAARSGHSEADVHGAVQGFLTSNDRFVTREEAVPIAEAAGQLIRKTEPADELFSEDLW